MSVALVPLLLTLQAVAPVDARRSSAPGSGALAPLAAGRERFVEVRAVRGGEPCALDALVLHGIDPEQPWIRGVLPVRLDLAAGEADFVVREGWRLAAVAFDAERGLVERAMTVTEEPALRRVTLELPAPAPPATVRWGATPVRGDGWSRERKTVQELARSTVFDVLLFSPVHGVPVPFEQRISGEEATTRLPPGEFAVRLDPWPLGGCGYEQIAAMTSTDLFECHEQRLRLGAGEVVDAPREHSVGRPLHFELVLPCPRAAFDRARARTVDALLSTPEDFAELRTPVGALRIHVRRPGTPSGPCAWTPVMHWPRFPLRAEDPPELALEPARMHVSTAHAFTRGDYEVRVSGANIETKIVRIDVPAAAEHRPWSGEARFTISLAARGR
ncbi:MAG: hypothetical protein AAFZ87_12460 [Planctomycetota bacterium]